MIWVLKILKALESGSLEISGVAPSRTKRLFRAAETAPESEKVGSFVIYDIEL